MGKTKPIDHVEHFTTQIQGAARDLYEADTTPEALAHALREDNVHKPRLRKLIDTLNKMDPLMRWHY